MALILCDLPRSIQVFFNLDRNLSYIHLVGFCLVVFVWLDRIGLGWILSGCVCMVGFSWARLDFVWLCLYGWIGLG